MRYMMVANPGGVTATLIGFADDKNRFAVEEKILAVVRDTQKRLGSTNHIHDLRRLEQQGEFVIIAADELSGVLRLPEWWKTKGFDSYEQATAGNG